MISFQVALLSFGSGFLVMAFDVKNDTEPIGTFKLPSDGKIIDCLQGVGVNIYAKLIPDSIHVMHVY